MSVFNPETLQKYESLFDAFLRHIEPIGVPEEQKKQLRRERYMIRDNLAFLKLPKELQPLYYTGDRALSVIPIADNGEKIVHLQTLAGAKHSSIQFAAGSTEYGAQTADMYLREGTAERLFRAEELLQSIRPELTFKVTDTLRPIELQRQYFQQIRSDVEKREGLQGEDLYNRVIELISDPDLCPPHTTGAAVDLTLIDIQTRGELDMGTAVDAIDDDRIYTFHPDIFPLAKKNRTLLYAVMSEAGFVNAPVEWWHYSYGDQDWALRTGHSMAIYDVCTAEKVS